MFERARNELMRACGYTYKECEAEGWGLPVTHAECNYRASARYDDLLEISAWVQAQKGVRLEIACEIKRKGEDQVLVNGFTRHAFIDLKTFRPCPPPEKFVAIMMEDVKPQGMNQR